LPKSLGEAVPLEEGMHHRADALDQVVDSARSGMIETQFVEHGSAHKS